MVDMDQENDSDCVEPAPPAEESANNWLRKQPFYIVIEARLFD